MSTAVPADAQCYVTQCYHYTLESLTSAEKSCYICVLSTLSVIGGKRPNKLYFTTPDYASKEFYIYIARKKILTTTNSTINADSTTATTTITANGKLQQ
jgi:hypothetical protein